jgi:hypothetical protein
MRLKRKHFMFVMGIIFLSVNVSCQEYHHHGFHQYPEENHYQPGHSHYSNYFGELQSVENIPLEKAIANAEDALLELRFIITKKEKYPLFGTVTARGFGDKRVEIHFKKQSDEITELWIRVGRLGDESFSRLLLEQIKTRA